MTSIVPDWAFMDRDSNVIYEVFIEGISSALTGSWYCTWAIVGRKQLEPDTFSQNPNPYATMYLGAYQFSHPDGSLNT